MYIKHPYFRSAFTFQLPSCKRVNHITCYLHLLPQVEFFKSHPAGCTSLCHQLWVPLGPEPQPRQPPGIPGQVPTVPEIWNPEKPPDGQVLNNINIGVKILNRGLREPEATAVTSGPDIMAPLKKEPLFRGVPWFLFFPKAIRICPQDNFPCRKKEIYTAPKNGACRVKFVKLKDFTG